MTTEQLEELRRYIDTAKQRAKCRKDQGAGEWLCGYDAGKADGYSSVLTWIDAITKEGE